jgi:hypothetical protein
MTNGWRTCWTERVGCGALAFSAVVGIAAAVVAAGTAYRLVRPDELSNVGGSASRAWRFVFYLTTLAGVASAMVAIVSWLARRRARAELIPPARVDRGPDG